MLDALIPLFGGEHAFSAVCSELRGLARTSGASAVGALHLTCSDESEFECSDAFRRDFAQELLPRLKYGAHVPFRIVNPGARYEWGSVAVAHDHFLTAAARRGWLLMVAKVNTHVAVARSGSGGLAFGRMDRYGDASTYCGAIHAALDGAHVPFAQALVDELQSDDVDRLALLRDEHVVAPHLAPLYGAILTARLHARRVAQDIQDMGRGANEPPFAYVVLHGVTLNRPGMDTELIGGAYVLDRRGRKPDDHYCGLGDDPRGYGFEEHGGKIRVRDGAWDKPRAARDHRRLAQERLHTVRSSLAHPQAKAALERTRAAPGSRSPTAALLKPALLTLAELAAVPTALFLFAEGCVGVHHAVRLHRAGSAKAKSQAARDVVADFEARLDDLSEEDARRILARLQALQASAS